MNWKIKPKQNHHHYQHKKRTINHYQFSNKLNSNIPAKKITLTNIWISLVVNNLKKLKQDSLTYFRLESVVKKKKKKKVFLIHKPFIIIIIVIIIM